MYVVNKNILSPKLPFYLWEGHWDRVWYSLGSQLPCSQGWAWICFFPHMLGLLQCPTRLPSWSAILMAALPTSHILWFRSGVNPWRGPQWLKPPRTQGSFSIDSHPSQSSSSSAPLRRLLECTQSSQPPAPSTLSALRQQVTHLHRVIKRIKWVNTRHGFRTEPGKQQIPNVIIKEWSHYEQLTQ